MYVYAFTLYMAASANLSMSKGAELCYYKKSPTTSTPAERAQLPNSHLA